MMPITPIRNKVTGEIVKVKHPEGATPEEIFAYADKHAGSTHAVDNAVANFARDNLGATPQEAVAKGVGIVGTGAAKAGAGLVNSVVDLTRGALNTGNEAAYGTFGFENSPQTPRADWQNKLDKGLADPSKFYQPEGTAGKLFEKAVEGAYSMAPTNKAQATLGALSGLGGELAARFFPDVPGARLGGSLAPMAPAAITAFRTPNVVKALAGALKENPEALAAAFANRARTGMAVPLPGGKLPSVVNELAMTNPNHPLIPITAVAKAAPEGAALRAQEGIEKAAVLEAQSKQLQGITPTPLNAETGAQVVNTGRAAATTIPQQKVAAATKPLYEDKMREDIIPPESINDLVGVLKSKQDLKGVRDFPQGAPYSQAAMDISRALAKSDTPGINALGLDEYGRDLQRAGAASRENGPAMTDTGMLVNDWIKGNSVPAAAGKMVHITGKDWFMDPAARTSGALFPPQGTLGSASTALKGQAAEDIPAIAKALQEAGATGAAGTTSEAFPLLLKKGMQDATEGASPGAWAANVSGRTGAAAGTADAATRQSFLEQQRQLRLQQGASPQDAEAAAQGAANVMDAVQKMEAGRAAVAGSPSTEEFRRVAGESPLSTGLKMITPSLEAIRTWSLANALDRTVRSHTYGKINEMLTSPQGMDVLKEIAGYSPMQNAEEIMARVLGSQASQANAPGQGQ